MSIRGALPMKSKPNTLKVTNNGGRKQTLLGSATACAASSILGLACQVL
jgi:hypothetical protein